MALRCAAALPPEQGMVVQKGKWSSVSQVLFVTELMSHVQFHFNNTDLFINRIAIFTVVVSTQQEQNPRHGMRCKANMGS
jgi:hypothetical protein